MSTSVTASTHNSTVVIMFWYRAYACSLSRHSQQGTGSVPTKAPPEFSQHFARIR